MRWWAPALLTLSLLEAGWLLLNGDSLMVPAAASQMRDPSGKVIHQTTKSIVPLKVYEGKVTGYGIMATHLYPKGSSGHWLLVDGKRRMMADPIDDLGFVYGDRVVLFCTRSCWLIEHERRDGRPLPFQG